MLTFFQNPLTIYEPTKEMLLPFGMVFGASILSWVRRDLLQGCIFAGGHIAAPWAFRHR